MKTASNEFKFPVFLIQLTIFTGLVFLLHYYLVQNLFTETEFYFEAWKIYLFQLITVAALIYFLHHRSQIKPNNVLNTFVILSLIKMGAVVVFLLPLFLDKSMDPKPSVFSFFIPYFIFLMVETRYALKILNTKTEGQ